MREDGRSLYLLYPLPEKLDPWVRATVVPRLLSIPQGVEARRVGQVDGAWAIGELLKDDPDPDIVADWPDDIRFCCQALMTGPGLTIPIERLRFEILHVAPYPTDLEGAVEHNACWDALALQRRILHHHSAGDGQSARRESGADLV